MSAFTDVLSLFAFGTTKDEAHAARVCVRCHEPVDLADMEPVDRDEYGISGLCPECWTRLFPPEEDEE